MHEIYLFLTLLLFKLYQRVSNAKAMTYYDIFKDLLAMTDLP